MIRNPKLEDLIPLYAHEKEMETHYKKTSKDYNERIKEKFDELDIDNFTSCGFSSNDLYLFYFTFLNNTINERSFMSSDGFFELIKERIYKETDEFELKSCVLGYIQRGGHPSARDRLLANYMVCIGIDQLIAGKHSKAICRKSRKTTVIDLSKAVSMRRKSENRTLVSVFNKVNQQ